MSNPCPNCGTLNLDDARFCQSCGTSLAQAIPGLGMPTGLLPPHTLLAGRYLIVQIVGRGGLGAVYRATDTRLGYKVVAIKEMSDAAITDPLEKQQARRAFEQEAQMLARLNHPNLPRVTDHFSERGKQYLVMDFIEGQTLEEILSQTPGFLSEKEVADWAVQLCEVLDYLHSQQPPVIFRDLKPGNIMVDREGKVRLIDFGIARLFKPWKTADTIAFGTVGYAPPEQYGKGQTDARSDIYALGATLHHLLTRHDPAMSPFYFPPVRSLNPSVSEVLDQVIARAVNQDPNLRWQSAREMLQALTEAVPISARATPAGAPVPQPSVTRGISQRGLRVPVGTLISAGLLVLLLLIIGLASSHWWGPWLRVKTLGVSPAGTAIVVPTSTPRSLLPITASNVARLTDLAHIYQEILDLAWSPDGQTLALATANGVLLYEPVTVTSTGFISTTSPLALAFSPDGRRLVTGGMDNVVRLWEASSGRMLLQLEGHAAPITTVSFSPRQLLASGSKDNSVRVWDATHGVEKYQLKGHSDWLLSISFSPDGLWLASGGRDHLVWLWDMKSGATIHTFRGHTRAVTSVTFAPDSRWLASGSEDGTARLWDPKQLTEKRVLAGHLAGVTSVVFSPDGRLLASGSRDGTVRLWDVETGVELRTLKGHTGEVVRVVFAPDGHWLVSGSNDGTVRLWGVR